MSPETFEQYSAKVLMITTWNFLALIVVVIAITILYVKANRTASLNMFFMVLLSMFIWLTGKILKTVSPTLELRWFFTVFYYFGICLLQVSFLDFGYVYNKGIFPKKWIRIILYIIPLFQFIFVATNPYHYLFYRKYGFWGDGFGKLFYLHFVIEYIYLIIGIIYCTKKFRKQVKYKDRFQKYLIISAVIIPLILNFLYVAKPLKILFKMLGVQSFDITPIVFSISLIAFLYATFKYEFFDLSPIMKHEITNRLDTPILILENKENVLFSNKKFYKIFNIDDNYEQIITLLNKSNNDVISYKDKYFSYNLKTLEGVTKDQEIITFSDVTTYERAKNKIHSNNIELNNANKKLEKQIKMLKKTSRIGARNYVARELHDIVGHSLVVTMKLLEVCKIYHKTNEERVKESLQNAKLSLRNGFNEMREIKMLGTGKSYNSKILDNEIKMILKSVEVSGIKINYFMRGYDNNIDEKVFVILRKVTTELITNTLKHAQASNIFLALTLKKHEIHLNLMDNGKGINKIIKGNGLSGIDSRLELVSGIANYESSVGEGFVCNIYIPK